MDKSGEHHSPCITKSYTEHNGVIDPNPLTEVLVSHMNGEQVGTVLYSSILCRIVFMPDNFHGSRWEPVLILKNMNILPYVNYYTTLWYSSHFCLISTLSYHCRQKNGHVHYSSA